MSNIEIRDLVKRYGTVEALHAINIKIEPGEFAVLVGPSGCGKSTTLRMVAGLETISGGEIVIGDRVVNGLRPKERGIAMVFQNYALYPSKTVYQNMAFSLKLSRVPKDVIDQKVRAVAEILELTELLERKPGALSGGQRQRVAMGRAIVRDPKVFLFDEPLSNLDAKLRGQMRVEIKRLHQRLKNTIIYVTHDQVEAMTLADRIVVMRDGHIEQQGTPDEIFHDPASEFVAGFMGSPAMNLVKATAGADAITIGDTSIPWALPASISNGDTLTFGLRPEDIRPAIDASEVSTRLTVTLELIEQLGTEKLIYFTVGGHSFVGKAEGRADLRVGQSIEVAFDMVHAYGFSPNSGARLR
ncbi:sn-glycerol-3-phosphate ABC transporter ATP-binding protein UgpC [Devosia rhodophyticola]|uniref:Sn-glycerol-3-phosphate ABC transporter ATP-binding protein UgpC n=1 Tax=Devosia rhodophyticola TaxID=3026423 RepID=A0ABY7YZG1_9HYPH|nr:sn-glycerol-3-phosphate ABC transporter ATP-binding protein UgpC [Devosia rhodophyticola]WDR06165.1 sn-glycerol-3-phosphate ABC transporter ATP-binding protein UgpC [Devosia rhodophyticola]